MRLADFILSDMEAILQRWDDFAATLKPAAARMKRSELRDHAPQILQAVARDLTTPQTKEAQTQKSMGLAAVLIDAKETAAQNHAVLRAQSGFNIRQLCAEYRALRASVLSLWADGHQTAATDLDDITRFNEAIDQALAESVDFFSARVDQARNLFLGILGHDLRTPLQTIHMTAFYLARLNAGEQVTDAALRLINSGAQMKGLLDDLLDFNRTNLGLGINVSPAHTDMAQLFASGIEQLRAAHPDHQIELEVTGNTEGLWDGLRLQQLLGNLIENAIKYGAPGSPVRVLLNGEDDPIRFDVVNRGPAIQPSALYQMFEPLKRGREQHSQHGYDSSLGLGLYIAREIAKAHGGDIEARSDDSETVFTVRLPRR